MYSCAAAIEQSSHAWRDTVRSFASLFSTAATGSSGIRRPHLHTNTPLLFAPKLSNELGRDVFLKMDCVQPSGSFKIRGVGYLCQKAVRETGCKLFVSSSGGNAGAAVAYAGFNLQVKVIVVVPSTTPAFMQGRLVALGAEVVVHGNVWNEADLKARQILAEVTIDMHAPIYMMQMCLRRKTSLFIFFIRHFPSRSIRVPRIFLRLITKTFGKVTLR